MTEKRDVDSSSDISPFKEEISPEAQAAREKWQKEVAEEKAEFEAQKIKRNIEEKIKLQERQKHIFHCFDSLEIPALEVFCPETQQSIEDHAIGYGGPTKHEALKPALIADWIKDNPKTHFKTDIHTGILYFYNGKNWVTNAEPYLAYLVNLILGKEARISHYNNIEFSLKAKTTEKIIFSKKIACLNGLLDVETLEFTDYGEKTENELTFYSIPVNYDPEAKCPNWEAFVSQVVAKDDVATLQEWSGYCLLPIYSYHKVMWIVGSGRNGKGVWQRTIENIVGQECVSNVGLEEFDGSHRFAMSLLYGKLVNFCSEPRTNRELQTTLLKYATGQDTIEAEQQNKQKRLTFRNCAKVTVLANKFPKVSDQTTAFRERRLFLKFPNEFIGKEQIVNIEVNWLVLNDERSGILNWMLKGLQRLIAQGYFTTSRTQEETELEFLRASDSVSALINETAIYGKQYQTTRNEAKEAYIKYCDLYGIEPENEKKLAAKLRETPHVKDAKTRIDGKSERVWVGISFKEDIKNLLDFKQNEADEAHEAGKINSLYSENHFENIKEYETSASSAPSAPNSNPEVFKNRFCGSDCGNYGRIQCPRFTMKIPRDNPMPLKCYGYKNPPPTEDAA